MCIHPTPASIDWSTKHRAYAFRPSSLDECLFLSEKVRAHIVGLVHLFATGRPMIRVSVFDDRYKGMPALHVHDMGGIFQSAHSRQKCLGAIATVHITAQCENKTETNLRSRAVVGNLEHRREVVFGLDGAHRVDDESLATIRRMAADMLDRSVSDVTIERLTGSLLIVRFHQDIEPTDPRWMRLRGALETIFLSP